MKVTYNKRVITQVEGEPENIRERLLWVRYDKRLRQEAFASLIGISRNTVSSKETLRPQGDWTTAQLFLLGAHFKLNMNWLFYGEGEPYRKC